MLLCMTKKQGPRQGEKEPKIERRREIKEKKRKEEKGEGLIVTEIDYCNCVLQ
jgi:hypothetical protein